MQKELENKARVLSSLLVRYIWSEFGHMHVSSHASSHIWVTVVSLFIPYILTTWLHSIFLLHLLYTLGPFYLSFECLYCWYLCLCPPPPTGTGSFIKSEEFCFLLLLHRFLGFLGSGLLAPSAVGWYFEEYRLGYGNISRLKFLQNLRTILLFWPGWVQIQTDTSPVRPETSLLCPYI